VDDGTTSAGAIPIGHSHLAGPRVLTYEELSGLTGISISTLRRRVADGSIPYLQPGGPRTRVAFPIDILERLLRQQTHLTGLTGPKQRQHRVMKHGPAPKWMKSH
jgi:excisionase family DNA binding protein